MHHEQLAIERKNLNDTIDQLQTMLKDMESDFAECARTGKTPCFFCVNDDKCDYQRCNFVWKPHN